MATMKSWRNFSKAISQRLKWCWLRLIRPLILGIVFIFSSLWQFLARNIRFIFVLSLTIALILFCILCGILPTTQNFEGNLTVKSLSFTNTQSDKLLLKDVRSIPKINLSGIQKFTLSGTFISKAYPELEKVTKLEIELPQIESQWSMSPVSNTDVIGIKELRLQENTRILNLKFANFDRRLSFTVTPSANSSQTPVTFSFNPTSKPIKISLSRYLIKNLSLSSNDATPLEFILQDATEFPEFLQPSQPIVINLDFPKDEELPSFARNIDVIDVKFAQILKQSVDNIGDDIPDSTITSGTIRMAKQELKLEENQFLIIEPPAIQTISRIKIIQPEKSQELKADSGKIKLADPPKGLEVTVSGSTNSIKVGLNPKLPIAQIQGSFLSGYVSIEVIVAIISFSGGLIVSLFSWLFNNLLKSSTP
jgi:hypothetical protein